MAIKANIVIDQGADFSALIDVADVDGNTYSLNGHTASSQMRKSYYSTTFFSFTTSVNAIAGQVSLNMDNATTAAIEPGRYVYDVEITSPENVTTRVVEGIVTVTPGITRI